MERFWCTHTCMPIFPLLLLRLWNTQTRLLGQAVVTFYFPPSTPFFSPPSQSRLISVPSQSQGVCGRVEKPNRVFPQYIRFSYFLSLSLLVISKQSTDKERIFWRITTREMIIRIYLHVYMAYIMHYHLKQGKWAETIVKVAVMLLKVNVVKAHGTLVPWEHWAESWGLGNTEQK